MGIIIRETSKCIFTKSDYTVKKPLSLNRVAWGTLLVFVLIYFLYSMLLDSYSTEIINNVNDIINNM